MPEPCPFCTQLREHIESEQYRTEQAHQNGRRDIDRYTSKYVAAYSRESYFDGELCGRLTAYFHELNFCPICGTDLRQLLDNKQKQHTEGDARHAE